MMITKVLVSIAIAAMLLVAGCVSEQDATSNLPMADVYNQQVVAPNAAGQPGATGETVQGAVDAYNNPAPAPVVVETTGPVKELTGKVVVTAPHKGKVAQVMFYDAKIDGIYVGFVRSDSPGSFVVKEGPHTIQLEGANGVRSDKFVAIFGKTVAVTFEATEPGDYGEYRPHIEVIEHRTVDATKPAPQTISGKGETVKAVVLTAGTHIVTASASSTSKYGSDNFIVHIEDIGISGYVYNEIVQGSYRGEKVIKVPADGTYLLSTEGGCQHIITIG
jgi:hypothetical protein